MENFTVNDKEYRVVDGRVYDSNGYTAVLIAEDSGGYDDFGWSLGGNDKMLYFPPLVRMILERGETGRINTGLRVFDPLRGTPNFPGDVDLGFNIRVRWVKPGAKFRVQYHEDREGWVGEVLLIEDEMEWEETRRI